MAVTKSGNEERSLIEDLPGLIRRGKKEAESILKGSETPDKGLLFSAELVYPDRCKPAGDAGPVGRRPILRTPCHAGKD